MNLSVGQEIQIKNVPVRYDGEGSNLFWFTLMVPDKKTSFCMRKENSPSPLFRKLLKASWLATETQQTLQKTVKCRSCDPTLRSSIRGIIVPFDFETAHLTRCAEEFSAQESQKTAVWSREDAKTLLDSIPKDSVSGPGTKCSDALQLHPCKRGTETKDWSLKHVMSPVKQNNEQ